ncbi:membrane protein insertase YidC [Hydrocarboniclastica marina]|uniref:Membrane protein insertase YidC n=1 Tax=Hydrocarboniclastica marina TaxID=2259620 RepID=A0A4P7XD97_9ALTE|nr:membrane protein insertase YidC [Hydrocarboniclastica marina]MAM00456.1 membrane protein insertase YidC [Alteromonadaceae bacterium]QCF24473.1 membrane protein insertase YidC [Hydrocarboniclastica marina]
MDIQRIIIWAGLAVVSYLMVLAWNEDYHVNRPVQDQQVTQAIPEQSSEIGSPVGDEFSAPDADTAVTQNGQSGTDEATQGQVVSGGGKIEVVTDLLAVDISQLGGHLVSARLLEYDQTLNGDDPLPLLRNDNRMTYVLESSLVGPDGPDGRGDGGPARYRSAASRYQLDDGQDQLVVDLELENDTGAAITKRYIFSRNSYQIEVRYLVDNTSESVWRGNFSGKIVRDQSPDPTAQDSFGIQSFLGLVLNTPEDPYEKYDFSDLQDKSLNLTVNGGWIAFLQHYFLTAWVPGLDQTHRYQTTRRGDLQVMGFVSPTTQVQPGERGELGAKLYIGPKIIDRLENVAPNMDRTVDFGWLFFISYPLFLILEWFYGIVGNWGVAIILLTVVVKLAFFKLSATSYRSMANMRRVTPQIQRLREQYGDDRQKMSQEMMALYKKEKINPLGGCLPILVQMPVFIALYWCLFESVQLRHAPFMLWIQDLSVMDPYFVLPILMGASMFLQMSLNPTPPDPIQARVMKLMPLIFTVFFLWFPAGLVLYWLVNNILSIAQQWVITHQIENGPKKPAKT